MAKIRQTVDIDMDNNRLENLADGIAAMDAVNLQQLQAAIAGVTIPDADETTTGKIRIATQSEVDAGTVNNASVVPSTLAVILAATLASATVYADAGDLSTLNAAKSYADSGDAATLTSANNTAAAGDAATLTSANSHSDANDATTLANANSYTDTQIAANAVPAASETVAGKIEIATSAETNTGTDDQRAVTPLKLASAIDARGYATTSQLSAGIASANSYTDSAVAAAAVPLASTTVQGKIEIATQTEVNTGTDSIRAVVPATLSTYVAAQIAAAAVPAATETVAGKIEIATQVETDAGSDDQRAVTPAKLAAYLGANVGSYVPDGAPRNILLNADGRVNQRQKGSLLDLEFGLDCWHGLTQSTTMGCDLQQNVTNEMPFAIMTRNNDVTVKRFGLAQVVDTDRCRRLRGQTITVSGKASTNDNLTLRWAVFEWTGTANSVPKELVNSWTNSTFTQGQFFVNTAGLTLLQVSNTESFLTSTPKEVTPVSFNVGSSMNNLVFFFWTEAAVANGVEIYSRWQLEKGTRASSFDHRPFSDTYQAVKRYYTKSFPYGTVPQAAAGVSSFPGAVYAYGTTTSTTTGPHGAVRFDNEMCKTPTVTTYCPGTGSGNGWRRSDDAAVGPSASTGQISSSGFVVDGTAAPGTQGTFAIHWTAEATPTS